MIKSVRYYLWASYRRKKIDALLAANASLFRGAVLDIGGRTRGKFIRPTKNVDRWVFADIEEKHGPDIILDVTNMGSVADKTFDVINAIELFEHVAEPEKGLAECQRILKANGKIVISSPFMYGIHADPYDFQRWTAKKWELALKNEGFRVLKMIEMGYFFTVLADELKIFLKKSTPIIRYASYFLYPAFDLIVKLDSLKMTNPAVRSYVGGYFIIAEKNDDK